jgi:hypothetical protein
MPKRATTIQLVGFQRASQCKTIRAMLDGSVYIIGYFGLLWVGCLLIDWAMR